MKSDRVRKFQESVRNPIPFDWWEHSEAAVDLAVRRATDASWNPVTRRMELVFGGEQPAEISPTPCTPERVYSLWLHNVSIYRMARIFHLSHQSIQDLVSEGRSKQPVTSSCSSVAVPIANKEQSDEQSEAQSH
jgi:hypothetical protein